MNTLELSLLDEWDEDVLTAAVAAFVHRTRRLLRGLRWGLRCGSLRRGLLRNSRPQVRLGHENSFLGGVAPACSAHAGRGLIPEG